MILKVKLVNPNAQIPSKANDGDAGFDLYSCENLTMFSNLVHVIHTGVAVEIPYGCVGIIKDRSSLALKGLHIIGGVIDSGYRGELLVMMTKIVETFPSPIIEIRDKIAQLIIYPLAPMLSHIEIVDKLSESIRGNKGFGSSDFDGSRKEEAGIGITPEILAGAFLNNPEICKENCELTGQMGRHFKSDHYAAIQPQTGQISSQAPNKSNSPDHICIDNSCTLNKDLGLGQHLMSEHTYLSRERDKDA